MKLIQYFFFCLMLLSACSKTIADSTLDRVHPLNRLEEATSQLELSGIVVSVKNSARLATECFSGYDDCFILPKIGIIGQSMQSDLIAYIQKTPKNTEDNVVKFNLNILNLKNNETTYTKVWDVEDPSDTLVINDFLLQNRAEVEMISKKYKIKLLDTLPLFDKHVPIDNIKLSFSTLSKPRAVWSDRLPLKNILITSKGKRAYFQNVQSKSFCPECSNYLYKVDLLGEIYVKNSPSKILVLGLLESIPHSPSALHLRLVSIPK